MIFVWLFAPYWLFILLALGFYFIPFFQPFTFIFPFLITLIFGWILAPSFLAALFLGIVFILIIGIKDLMFIDRVNAYEFLIFILLFLIYLNFYSYFAASGGFGSVLWFTAIGFAGYFLILGFIRSLKIEAPPKMQSLTVGIVSLLLWQLGLVILYLPMNPFYGTALLFLAAAGFIELSLDYLSGKLDRAKILTVFFIFFIFVVFILVSNQWVV